MTTLKVKELTFEKLFPNAEIVLYDNNSQTLEIDGKIAQLDNIDLNKEFIKTKIELEKAKQQKD